MSNQKDEKYDIHMKLVKQALDLYTIRYKGDFDNTPNINRYRIDYNKLIDEKLITEDIVKCSGIIDLTKKNNNSYTYDYYLKCTDLKGNVLDDKLGTEPSCNSSNCVTIN